MPTALAADPAACLAQFQRSCSLLLDGADAALAAYAGAVAPSDAASGSEASLQPLWHAAELAQRRGRFAVSTALLTSIDALLADAGLSPLRRQALERAERLLYLQGNLQQAWQLRLRLRALYAASADPDEQALEKTEPLRQWRLELGADQQALDALRDPALSAPSSPQLVAAAAAGGPVLDPALQTFAQRIEQAPNATVLAFALQQQLRQRGLIGGEAPVRPAAAAIPQRLWLLRQHPGSTPELEQREAEWRRACPGWQLQWLDHAPETLWADETLPPLVRAAASCVNDPAVRGDLLRLAMLWQHGGLAPEWNTAPLEGLLPLLEGCSLVLTYNEWGCVSLELVAATPQHPWLGAALQQACRQALEGQGYSRWDVSGDCLLSGVFARWLAPDLARGLWPEGLRLLPLPELRRHLALWRGLPRPADLPPEEPFTALFNHSQRRRAGRWLAARQEAAAPQ